MVRHATGKVMGYQDDLHIHSIAKFNTASYGFTHHDPARDINTGNQRKENERKKFCT